MGRSAAWKLVGVSADAREAAREGARQSGLALGEWLSRKILSDRNATSQADPSGDAKDQASTLVSLVKQLSGALDGICEDVFHKAEGVEGRLEELVGRPGDVEIDAELQHITEKLAQARSEANQKFRAIEKALHDLAHEAAPEPMPIPARLAAELYEPAIDAAMAQPPTDPPRMQVNPSEDCDEAGPPVMTSVLGAAIAGPLVVPASSDTLPGDAAEVVPQDAEGPPVIPSAEDEALHRRRLEMAACLAAARKAAAAAQQTQTEHFAGSALLERLPGAGHLNGLFDFLARKWPKAFGMNRNKALSLMLAAGVAVVVLVTAGVGEVLKLSSSDGHAVPPSGVHAVVPDSGLAQYADTASSQDVEKWKQVALHARQGDARAQMMLGLRDLGRARDGPALADAVKWLSSASAKGEPAAQFRLATLYASGRGVGKDEAKAFQLLLSAASGGNRSAMYTLGVAYVQGKGTPANLTEAARWFLQAAQLGLVDAQFDVAVLYERGMGAPQSLTTAYRWYSIAAAAGDTEARRRADIVGTQLSAEERAAVALSVAHFKATTMSADANATGLM